MVVSAASVASVLVRCYGLLLKQGDIGARAACWCAPIAYTARITCSEELVTGMGCRLPHSRPWYARHSAVAAKACGTCHAVLLQLI